MLRDFRNNKKIAIASKSAEEIERLFKHKSEMEENIAKHISDFEGQHGVIIDRVQFSRHITRTPNTVYTDLSILVE